VYLQAQAESATPTSTPPKKLFEFVQISRPTLAEVGWARAHPWLRHCCIQYSAQSAVKVLSRSSRLLVTLGFYFYSCTLRLYTFLLQRDLWVTPTIFDDSQQSTTMCCFEQNKFYLI